MKLKFYAILFSGIYISIATAQDSKSNNKLWRKIEPQIKVPYLDTMLYKIPSTQNFGLNISPVAIPNPLDREEVYDRYRMPTVKLSGQELAPMPGTQNLDYEPTRDSIMKIVPLKIMKKENKK